MIIKRKVPVDLILCLVRHKFFRSLFLKRGEIDQNSLLWISRSEDQPELNHHGIPDAAYSGHRGLGVCRGGPPLPDHRGGYPRVAHTGS